MIDSEKLLELRANHAWPEYDNASTTFNEMADTIEFLWKENAWLKTVRISLQKEIEGLVDNCQRWKEKYETLEGAVAGDNNMICFRCKHYAVWHLHKTGLCEYRTNGVVCPCREFLEEIREG